MSKLGTLLIVAVIACASCASPGARGEEPSLEDGTASALFAYASNYAAQKGYTFGDGAEYFLSQAAQEGASDIQAAPLEKRRELIKEARANFGLFIDEMIKASREIPGYAQQHPGKIGEQTYFKASSLCPIWPICKKPKR